MNPTADFIAQFEGCRLKAYLCPAGVWTCGFGSTGPDINESTVWTQEEAAERFASDLEKFKAGVSALVKVALTPGQLTALISFAYNLGLGSLERSSLLSRLNACDQAGAADEFLKWVHVNGKELPGLVARRAAERKLFLT